MKKFGKLRQWTDEKLGASHKTLATEEFREMEIEMQIRQQGLESIENAITVWMKALGKKKEGHDKEKGFPLELLGIALFQHGEDFAPESAYGQCLSRFGIAQQKIARAQEAFQQKVSDYVVTNIQRSLATMKDCQAARKKLESRRLAYDSALGKVQKAKKEDSKLEEDLRAAKIRYEESVDDVQQRMLSIRDAEANNVNDIADFIEAQADYFDHARDVMLQLRTSFDTDIGRRDPPSRSRRHPQVSPPVALDEPTCPLPRRIQSHSTSSLPQDQSTPIGTQRGTVPGLAMLHADQRSLSQLSFLNGSCSEISSSFEGSGPKALSMQRLNIVPLGPREILKKVKANFVFEAEAPNELSIRPGDIITVSNEVSDGWWEGHIVDEAGQRLSRKGLFPANYCTSYVPDIGTTEVRPGTLWHRDSSACCTTEGTESFSTARSQAISAGSMRSKPPPPPIPKKKQNLQATVG